MGKIQTTPKSKMTNSEFQNFCMLLIQFINNLESVTQKFQSVFDAFDLAYKDYYNSLFKINKKVYTEKTSSLKKKINTSRTGFFNLIKGACSSQVEETAQAAQSLLSLIDNYKYLSNMRFDDLKTYTARLLEECNSEEYKVHIEKLEFTGRVTGLQTLYDQAVELKLSLIEDDGLNKRLRKTVNTRRDLNKAYDRMHEKVNALVLVNGDEEYIELITFWNALIDEYRSMITDRLGAGEGGKPSDEDMSNPNNPSGGDNKGEEDDRPVIE